MRTFRISSKKPLNFPNTINVLHSFVLYDQCVKDSKYLQNLLNVGYTLQELKDDNEYLVECEDIQTFITFCEQNPEIIKYWER